MTTQKTSNNGLSLAFGAALLQCVPRISDTEMQEFINDPKRLKNVLSTAFRQIPAEDFDEAAYFQTRPGLWVDPDLERYVGFSTKPTRGLQSLTSYVLQRDTSEAEIFGMPGTDKRAAVMTGAVELSQIAALIDLQPGGTLGKLLNDGRANLFAVIGKNGELRVVHVSWDADNRKWRVICSPWRARLIWDVGGLVFSNKS